MPEEKNIMWFQKRVVALISMIVAYVSLAGLILTGIYGIKRLNRVCHDVSGIIEILTDNADSMEDLTKIIEILNDDDEEKE